MNCRMGKTFASFLCAAGLLVATPGFAQVEKKNRVDYREGQLSVSADNMSLGEVFSEVARQAGVKVDVAPAVASLRVTTSISSKPLHDAILKILEGSRVDFIIVKQLGDASKVERVMLLGVSDKAASSGLSAFGGSNYSEVTTTTSRPGFPVNPFTGTQAGAPAIEATPQSPGQPPGTFLPFPDAAEPGAAPAGTIVPQKSPGSAQPAPNTSGTPVNERLRPSRVRPR